MASQLPSAQIRVWASRTVRPALTTLALILSGCGDQEVKSGPLFEGEWVVERTTIGDTTVVHTVGGSVWGSEMVAIPDLSIGELEGPEEYMLGSVQRMAVGVDGGPFIYDSQAGVIRKYDSEGRWLLNFGREGEGPGEFGNPTILLPNDDGGLTVIDASQGRFTDFGADGEVLRETRQGALSEILSISTIVDSMGRVYSFRSLRDADGLFTGQELVRVARDGAGSERVALPSRGLAAPNVRIRMSETGFYNTRQPFAPDEIWAVGLGGEVLRASSGPYQVDLLRADGRVLRISRQYEPVPLSDPERAMMSGRFEEAITVPEFKSAFSGIRVSPDGTIMLQVHLPLDEGPLPDFEADPLAVLPYFSNVIRAHYDVFQPDGTYLGRLRLPSDVAPGATPYPGFHQGNFWGVTRDELDVQRLVRFRLVPLSDEAGGSR